MKIADKIATGIFWMTFGLTAFLIGVVALIAGFQSLFLATAEWFGFTIGLVIGGSLMTTVIYGFYRSFWGSEERNPPERVSVRDVVY